MTTPQRPAVDDTGAANGAYPDPSDHPVFGPETDGGPVSGGGSSAFPARGRNDDRVGAGVADNGAPETGVHRSADGTDGVDDGVAGTGVAGTGVAATGVGEDEDEGDDDGDFAPRPRQRLGLLSAVLVMALAVALGFLGGEIVQKHYGGTASAAAATTSTSGSSGGYGGYGGYGTGGQTGTGGTNTGTGTTSGTGTGTGTSTAAVPAVIGTVASVKGTTMVVTNLGGSKVTVRLTNTTTVTVSVKNHALKAGQTVSVVGRTANKVVTATSVTVR